jgi:hypothetical protein
MVACSTKNLSDTEQVKAAPKVMDMEVLADRSYQDFFSEDPYSQLTKYIIDTYHPDRELYNFLFKAIVNKEKSVDTSSYKLTPEQIMNTVSGIYEQAGLQLFYLNRAKWSKDYKTINITYREVSEEQIKNYQDTFYSQMNHLLYNVAPSDYDPYQKFFAVYEYVTKHAGYTDDMNDDTTTTPGSLLVNQKSICGGFSSIANYVLNFVGVPTDYISNDAHAWNIVNLMGNYYSTDFTWGAIYDSNISFLNTALMDSKVRKMGLDNLGYGDSKSIVGYPGGSEETPEDCTDNRYDFLKDIYENYALDIDNKWIYYSTYSNDQGIHRIRLDGTGEELVTPKPGFQIKAFDGVLYFADADENMMLYKWEEGKAPVSLDSSTVTYLELKDNKLRYNVAKDTNDIREISLSKFIPENFQADSSQHFASYQLPKNQTFQIVITFSEQMSSQSMEDYIGLISKTGKNIPIAMVWSEDYKKLTIRSKEFINQEEGVSLKVASGIEAVSGLRTVDHYDKAIQFID